MADEETWKPMGTGYLRDDLLTSYYRFDSYFEFEVEVEQSEQTPGRYRLVNAYRNCPNIGTGEFPSDIKNYIVVDASVPDEVRIEQGLAGFYVHPGKTLAVWSQADYQASYMNSPYTAKQEGLYGMIDEGNIYFPQGTLLVNPWEGDEMEPGALNDAIWIIANNHGKFHLRLPGAPDFEVKSISVADELSDGKVDYTVTLGNEVEYALCAVFEGEWNDDDVDNMKSGKTPTVRIEGSTTISFPYDKDGQHTLIVIPYYNGKDHAPGFLTREWNFSKGDWNDVGTGTYTEAILSSNEMNKYGLTYPEYTYEVKIQQHATDKGRIRLVNPYGEGYPNYIYTAYDHSRNWYMVFDLTHFNCVMLERNDGLGFDSGYGQSPVWCWAHRAMTANQETFGRPNQTIEEIINDVNIPKGYYDPQTRKVTFDKGALKIQFPPRPDTWYDANQNGHFLLTIPDGVELPEQGVDDITADYGGTPEYWTLSGMKADASSLAPGIYLRRLNGRTQKVIVR